MKTGGITIAGLAAFVAVFSAMNQGTRESIAWAWTFTISLIQNSPIGLWAVILGVVIGWLSMLWARFLIMPLGAGEDVEVQHGRRLVIWLVGLLGSLLPTYIIWPTPFGAWLGGTIGLAAPWSWEAVVLIVNAVSPEMAKKLRGVQS